jgi:hypothetical protein
MSPALLMEVSLGGDEWRPGTTLAPGDPEGSISHNWPDGKRDLILFRCCGDYSLIRLSAAGTDFEYGHDRIVTTAGLREIARLEPGDRFDMAVVSDRGASYRARWTHQDERS